MRRALGTLAASVAALIVAGAGAAQDDATPDGAAPRAEGAAAAPDAQGESAAPDASEASAKKEADPKAKALPLAELRARMQRELEAERVANQERLESFRKEKLEQERLLAEAKATLVREEAVSGRLEQDYTDNELAFERDQKRLEERLSQLGELFGVVRQVATDASGNIWASITSAELGQRKELLDRLGRSKELPSTVDLERLWYELQREMTAQGQVSTFTAPVLTESSQVEQREVTRVGPFAALGGGRYLKWEPKEAKLREFRRRAPARYVDTAEGYVENEAGYASLAVDPSRGTLLEALTEEPYFYERIAQGGFVGYTIISLAAIAFLLGAWRWSAVTLTSRRVASQARSRVASLDNPLGRMIAVYEENKDMDPEHLELKLDHAMMKESARLTRMMWLIRTVSVVAPLLGLLGTVTGMIQTFQAITLFGTGDPKVMAGGISEALVTTMLGLIAAIPLVLLYETLSNSTRQVATVLDENVASMIASRTEARQV